MEPKLNKQSEIILSKLQKEVDKKFFTEDEMRTIRQGLVVVQSLGILGRFVVVLATVAAAIQYFLPGAWK